MVSAEVRRRIEFLGNLAGRASTHIIPDKAASEISNRLMNLKYTGTPVPLDQKQIELKEDHNEILFVYNQFKIREINKRLNITTEINFVKSSSLSMRRMVKIRHKARLDVIRMFNCIGSY